MASSIENTEVEKPDLEEPHCLAADGHRIRGNSFLRFLEEEVWPGLPAEARGRRPTQGEEDEILGYGPEGV